MCRVARDKPNTRQLTVNNITRDSPYITIMCRTPEPYAQGARNESNQSANHIDHIVNNANATRKPNTTLTMMMTNGITDINIWCIMEMLMLMMLRRRMVKMMTKMMTMA